jgi:hypothetical protein
MRTSLLSAVVLLAVLSAAAPAAARQHEVAKPREAAAKKEAEPEPARKSPERDVPAKAAEHPAPSRAAERQAAPDEHSKPAATRAAADGEQSSREAPAGKDAQPPAARKATLNQVLLRINQVVAEHNAKVKATQTVPVSRPGQRRVESRAGTPSTAPSVSLSWETGPSVSLSWDSQLDPRRLRQTNLGVRLSWPE